MLLNLRDRPNKRSDSENGYCSSGKLTNGNEKLMKKVSFKFHVRVHNSIHVNANFIRTLFS